MSEIPRRALLDSMCKAERAIYDAALVVEDMAADVRLTNAVLLLKDARDSVADYIDGVAGPDDICADHNVPLIHELICPKCIDESSPLVDRELRGVACDRCGGRLLKLGVEPVVLSADGAVVTALYLCGQCFAIIKEEVIRSPLKATVGKRAR